jgi:hypothetical protein
MDKRGKGKHFNHFCLVSCDLDIIDSKKKKQLKKFGQHLGRQKN